MAEQRTRNYRGRNKAHICLSRVLLSAVTWAAGSAFVESHIGPLRLSKRHTQITVRALHPHARHRSFLRQRPKTFPRPRPTPALDSAERLQSKQVRSVYQAVEMFFCATFLLTGREHLAVGWRTSSAASPHFAGSPLAQLARRVDWILLSDWSVEP